MHFVVQYFSKSIKISINSRKQKKNKILSLKNLSPCQTCLNVSHRLFETQNVFEKTPFFLLHFAILLGMMYCIDRQSLLAFPPLPCYIPYQLQRVPHIFPSFLQQITINHFLVQWQNPTFTMSAASPGCLAMDLQTPRLPYSSQLVSRSPTSARRPSFYSVPTKESAKATVVGHPCRFLSAVSTT